jgi:predicted nucleic acid-binding Zn ribbon protein
MAGEISKNKKQTITTDAERVAKRKTKATQLIFAFFAIILILSMVLSLVTNF